MVIRLSDVGEIARLLISFLNTSRAFVADLLIHSHYIDPVVWSYNRREIR
jgi:hypothetical protein